MSLLLIITTYILLKYRNRMISYRIINLIKDEMKPSCNYSLLQYYYLLSIFSNVYYISIT